MEASDEMQCLWEWDKSLIFPFNAIHFFFTVQLLSTWKWLFISGCPDKECAALSGFGRDAQKGALGRSYVVPTTASTLVLLVSSSC